MAAAGRISAFVVSMRSRCWCHPVVKRSLPPSAKGAGQGRLWPAPTRRHVVVERSFCTHVQVQSMQSLGALRIVRYNGPNWPWLTHTVLRWALGPPLMADGGLWGTLPPALWQQGISGVLQHLNGDAGTSSMRLDNILLPHHQLCSRPRTAVQRHRVPSASVASKEYRGPSTVRPRLPLANSSTSALVSGHAITVKLEKLHICVSSASRKSNRTLRLTRLGTLPRCWPTSSDCKAHANCIASRPSVLEARREASRMRTKRRLLWSPAPWKSQTMA
jgi:hypothetical protein